MKKDIVNFITLIIVQTVHSMAVQTHSFSMDDSKPERGLVDFMSSKVYLPDDNTLPQISILKNTKDDLSYILSKLTDEELLNLLNFDPNKSIYDLNDIVQIALEGKTPTNEKLPIPSQVKQLYNNDMGKLTNVDNKKLRLPGLSTSQTAFHKLNHKQILPQNQKNSENFLALKKLQSLVHTRTRLPEEEKLNEERKELLFDILVAQLKTLCCKSTDKRLFPQIDHLPFDSIFEKIPIKFLGKSQDSANNKNNEFIFLILNDEIKSKGNEDLVLVDPDTLENNSSVLILGPVPSPLTDDQLKIVMNRISNELSKPEYASLLEQLSNGSLNDSNTTVMKNFIYGPETRRYIKAHRCNHQSKLAKIYGRPKWLICTGYLNINTPSLYD